MAGMAFGIMFSLLPLGFGTVLLGAVVVDSTRLGLGIGLGALAFASLGVFVAAPVISTLAVRDTSQKGPSLRAGALAFTVAGSQRIMGQQISFDCSGVT
jgi:hypothetical protein